MYSLPFRLGINKFYLYVIIPFKLINWFNVHALITFRYMYSLVLHNMYYLVLCTCNNYINFYVLINFN